MGPRQPTQKVVTQKAQTTRRFPFSSPGMSPMRSNTPGLLQITGGHASKELNNRCLCFSLLDSDTFLQDRMHNPVENQVGPAYMAQGPS